MEHDKIADYYNQTEFDYKIAWYSKADPALHFGMYNEAKANDHHSALSYTNQVLADMVNVSAKDHVLDAGCGLGSAAFWLARERNARVTGISITERQIAQCQLTANSLGLGNRVQFKTADYCHTTFDDASFDVVWACESVCHAIQKQDFYQEAYRLLKPGGRLVMAEYLRSSRELATADESLLRQRWLQHWMINDLDSEQEHLAHLNASGFAQISILNANDMVRVSLRNLHEKCTRSYPIELVLKWLGIRSKVQHGNLVGSINQYRAFQKGIWWYAIISATKPMN